MMTKQYKLTNNVIGWVLGIFASAVYIMTAEPTASWWDCGEYIATTYKMLVGHPPGAPTFQIIGHFFTLFAGGDVTKVAFCMNVMSAICSGLTIMFLFWTMTLLGKKLVAKMGGMTPGRQVALFGSALVGALTYTFTDTFWFSAVEGEVYAMSSFFTALVFWCILKWDEEYDNPKTGVNPNRWIILIAYLIGLSIGVHLLNLLTLPAIVLVVYFKLSKNASYMGVVLSLVFISAGLAIFFPTQYMFLIWLLISAPLAYLCYKKGTFKSKAEWGVLISLGLSFVLLATILYGIIPGIVSLAGKFEIFFINKIGLPFNSGTIIYFLLIFGLIAYGLYYGYKKQKRTLNAGILSFLFLLIGYSTFITLVIRSNANPTIDENNPEDAVSLLAYLNREQYGSNPLIHGYSYNSRRINVTDGKPVYVRDDAAGRYVISDDRRRTVYEYHPDDEMLFPRMWYSEKAGEYTNWIKNQYDPTDKKGKEVYRHLERNKPPTHEINVKFLHSYQLNYMYFRYFMWNFSGRQNDLQGRGDMYNGNWVTGIPFIDNILVGKQNELPTSMERPGHNRYYLLPLLLGIIGIIFYSRRDGVNSFIVLMLFVMTGLAIAFYLNMYAFQPRERDYAFAASFYAFSIWVGFGVFGIYSLFERLKNNKVQVISAAGTTILCILLVPCILAKENWDDHDRSNNYTTIGIAKNYLDSCEPNAILFTMGDNDTFPLWYVQEVEGYRTDVRVCNLSLLGASWYVDQMKRKVYESDPLPISMTWDQYKDGTRDGIVTKAGSNEFVSLKGFVDYIKSPEFNNTRFINASGSQGTHGRVFPASFSLPVDKEQVLATGTVKPGMDSLIVDKMQWNVNTNGEHYFYRPSIIMMDILVNNNWERPIYYATTTGPDAYLGLEEYFQLEGLAYRLVPIRTPKGSGYEFGRIDSEILYDKMVKNFNDHNRIDKMNNPNMPEKEVSPYLWGGFNDPRVHHNEDDVRLIRMIRRNFIRLANTFMREGNLTKAEEVLDHSFEIVNDKIFPYKMNADILYALSNINAIESYNEMSNANASEKAYAIADRITDYFIEDFAWYDKCNERTLDIQSENIQNNVYLLGYLLDRLPAEQMKKLEPKLKQISLSKVYMNRLDEFAGNIEKNMQRLDMAYNEVMQDLLFLKDYYLATAIACGQDELAQNILGVINGYVDQVTAISPQLGNQFKMRLN
ncbi:DUF2723 domain-containing protein [Bacteroidales bacterium OttesenSCG-928-B11]|nr:DUF2723 domain-containing protein [Bacteroidales bacterium OttesenSCG-928-E04]MDL2312602.1 DUF2723 domain-containing protein [Bacteroidales bacterium OttesenSCG-928-B11]